ncbi:hypothetical protein M3661_18415 [Paenibacillus sp. MER 180]|uniref:hypothetical protein n=1 Tax=Paenibacillus sp. MER 180 TaxID=2939570 RepID=UPI00204081EB|nr:hypothetical protein [Paenibacillus sp. MER 180]MCM3292098.1 hypothetical protein [Paenibacillus sp. MER 180]
MGGLLRTIGRVLLFLQVAFIFGFFVSLSRVTPADDPVGKLGFSVFVFGIPGLMSFIGGKYLKKRKETRKMMREQNLIPARDSLRVSDLLRFIGYIILFGIEWKYLTVLAEWPIPKSQLTTIYGVGLFFFILGIFMLWRASRIDAKADALYMQQQAENMNPSDEDNEDDEEENEDGDDEPVHSRAAAEVAASTPLLPKMVSCPGCGAQTEVPPRSTASCDYCGSAVPYE